MTTWLPVLAGSVVGTWFALARAPERPPARSEKPPAQPTLAVSTSGPTTAVDPPSNAGGAAPTLPSAPVQSPGTAASAAPSAASSASSPPKGNTILGPAFLLQPPADEKALLQTEVRCDRKSPEDCERAALALEAGKLLARDAPRATKLRRSAITIYVRQCETGRVLACARLAEMYTTGEQLHANPRSAHALRERVLQLCSMKPGNPECAALGVHPAVSTAKSPE